MTKYLVTTEFRYNSIPKGEFDSGYYNRTITNGVFDNIDDALNEGNNVIKQLKASGKFTIYDFFEKNHLFGRPNNLVTNGYKDRVRVYIQITDLDFDDVNDVINDVCASQDAFDKW